MQCKLTFKRCGWRLSCSESVNFRKPSLSSIIICLDFKIVCSGFTESLYLVCMTRTIINSNKPGRQTQNTYKLEIFSNHKCVCQHQKWNTFISNFSTKKVTIHSGCPSFLHACTMTVRQLELCYCHQPLMMCIKSATHTIHTGGSLNLHARSIHSASLGTKLQPYTGYH